jgi:hypothetical protein
VAPALPGTPVKARIDNSDHVECWDNEDALAAEAYRSDQRGAADLAAQGTEGERQVSLSL